MRTDQTRNEVPCRHRLRDEATSDAWSEDYRSGLTDSVDESGRIRPTAFSESCSDRFVLAANRDATSRVDSVMTQAQGFDDHAGSGQSLNRHEFRNLRNAAGTLLSVLQQLQPALQSTLQERNKLDYEREAILYKREYFRESSNTFVNQISAVMAPPGLPVPELRTSLIMASVSSDEIARQHKLLLEDQQAIQTQDNKIRAIELRLSRAEFSMGSKERRLAHEARRLVHILDGLEFLQLQEWDSLPIPEVKTQSRLTSRTASPTFHPLLEAYYDKAGDVRIMRERLIELEIKHQQSLSLRSLQEDQELKLEMSAEEFDANFRRARQEADGDYQAAQNAAFSAKQACLEAGISPQDFLDQGEENVVFVQVDDDFDGSVIYPPEAISSDQSLAEGPVTPRDRSESSLRGGLGNARIDSADMLTATTDHINGGTSENPRKAVQRNMENPQQRVAQWIESSDIADEIASGDKASTPVDEAPSPPEETLLTPCIDPLANQDFGPAPVADTHPLMKSSLDSATFWASKN